MNRTVTIVIGIVVLVAVGAGCFFAGTVYGKGQAAAAAANTFTNVGAAPGGFPADGPGRFQGGAVGTPGARRGGQGGFGGAAGGGPGGGTFGQIKEIGDGYMIIAASDGTETRVQVTDTTLIEKQASVTLKDLSAGETVVVSGSAGSDGTITARSVQVAPAGRFGLATPAPLTNP